MGERQIDAEVVAKALALAHTLDLRPCGSGTCITPFPQTQALFEPLLRPYFPGRWTRAMVVGLWPSQQIVGHTDPPIQGYRTHIPLDVNEGCWAFYDGLWLQPMVGHCYIMDPTKFHGAVNWGHTVRLHLAIDQEGTADANL